MIAIIVVFLILLSLIWQNKNGTGASWILKKIGQGIKKKLLITLIVSIVLNIMLIKMFRLEMQVNRNYYKQIDKQQQETANLKNILSISQDNVDKLLKEHKKMRKYFE